MVDMYYENKHKAKVEEMIQEPADDQAKEIQKIIAEET